MKNIIALLLILVASETYAPVGRTVHITPDTEKKYGFKVQFTDVENRKSTYRIQLKAVGYDEKHAWLTVTSEEIKIKEQDLVFSDLLGGGLPITEEILIRAKLHPIKKANVLYYEVEISSEYVRKGYIYIGFPTMVSEEGGIRITLDGGFRYLIELGAYADHHERLKAEAFNPFNH